VCGRVVRAVNLGSIVATNQRKVWISDELPKTSTGKILKREIVPPADLEER
jgi:acyl-coenzyme A synthetase/AMP-(fatty) acid ligase